jgi:hypothetical protein
VDAYLLFETLAFGVNGWAMDTQLKAGLGNGEFAIIHGSIHVGQPI